MRGEEGPLVMERAGLRECSRHIVPPFVREQTDGIDRTQGLAYSLERLQHVAFSDSKKRDVELLGRILGRDLQHWLEPRLRESRRQVASRR